MADGAPSLEPRPGARRRFLPGPCPGAFRGGPQPRTGRGPPQGRAGVPSPGGHRGPGDPTGGVRGRGRNTTWDPAGQRRPPRQRCGPAVLERDRQSPPPHCRPGGRPGHADGGRGVRRRGAWRNRPLGRDRPGAVPSRGWLRGPDPRASARPEGKASSRGHRPGEGDSGVSAQEPRRGGPVPPTGGGRWPLRQEQADRGEPSPGGLDRQAVLPSRNDLPRSGPGGKRRAHSGGGEVRLHQGV